MIRRIFSPDEYGFFAPPGNRPLRPQAGAKAHLR